MSEYRVTLAFLRPGLPVDLQNALANVWDPLHTAFIGDDNDRWELVLGGLTAPSLDAAVTEAIDLVRRAENDAQIGTHDVEPQFVEGPHEPRDQTWAVVARAQVLAEAGERAMAIVLLQTALERSIRGCFSRLLEARDAPELGAAVKRHSNLASPEGRALFAYLTGVDPRVIDPARWADYQRHLARRGAAAHGGPEPPTSAYLQSYQVTTWLLAVVEDATRTILS